MVLGGCEVVEGLVRPSAVVVIDPGPHGETGVFDGLEAPRPAELLFEGFDEAFAKTMEI